jgi:hypothetical protein
VRIAVIRDEPHTGPEIGLCHVGLDRAPHLKLARIGIYGKDELSTLVKLAVVFSDKVIFYGF